jgi:hypothetical protein
MEYGFGWPDDRQLVAVLKELDTSKALVRVAQGELGRASSELARSGNSPACLDAFRTANRNLSQATERYREAIHAFNAVCRKKVLAAAA